MTDQNIIEQFVEHLASSTHPGLVVNRWPDKENRRSQDIDAIAGQFAIEHTSIDTVPDQRMRSAQFMQVVGELESELSPLLTARLRITFEWEAVDKGQDWRAINRMLREWILKEAEALPDGGSTVQSIPGIPFRLHVNKASDRPPGLRFRRSPPDDDTLPGRLQAQLSQKLAKLEPYRGKGFKTLLLIESSDLALMCKDLMLDSIRHAFSNRLPNGADVVWFTDTSLPQDIVFHDLTKHLKGRSDQ